MMVSTQVHGVLKKGKNKVLGKFKETEEKVVKMAERENVYIKHEEQSKKRAVVGLTSLFTDIDQN